MYESHFRFERRPFSATPDSDCLFITDIIREILAEFVICAERGQGISILTGAAGMGKTLLCGRLAEELSGPFEVALLKNANFATRRSLLQSVLFELGLSYTGMGEQELRLELEKYCESILSDRSGVALIIDEAHLLSPRLLEEVRAITNLTADGIPLVRVILSGQLTLEETLAQPGLAALNQRIASQHHLEPLSRLESRQYIEYRINWGGANPQQVFTEEAIAAIAQAADGVPRALNQLCDHTLLLAFVSGQETADASLVDEALEDLRQLPLHWNERKRVVGPLDALQRTSADAAEEHVADDAAERFDFDAIADGEMESIEIGGTAEETSVGEYAIAVESAGEEAWMEIEDASELDVPRIDVEDEDEEEELMKPDAAPSVHTGSFAGVVPLMDDQRTGPVMFEEEMVVDHYAALDAARRERAPLSASKTNPPPQPEVSQDTPAVEEFTAAEPTAAKIEPAPAAVETHQKESVTPEPAATEEAGPTEEELGAAILNDCLKVHKSVIDEINRLDFGEIARIEMPDAAEEFDVVQLESTEPAKTLRHDRQPAPATNTAPEENENSAVPRPNLRRLFTKLRRVQHERSRQ